MLKAYLDRAEGIIGKRTSKEISHDNVVVRSLKLGHSIERALENAAKKYPSEAIEWNSDNIGDIQAHYEYLREHEEIMQKLQKKMKK